MPDCQDKYERLLAAVRELHQQKADDLCWMDLNKLYAAAGLPPGDFRVGSKPAMLVNCERYVQQVCIEGGPWKSYAELEAENEALKAELNALKAQ